MYAPSNEVITVLGELQAQNIYPILYGSVAVSLYLGPFKVFSDIDLLVPEAYLEDDWESFQTLLNEIGFQLTDEHEHEFLRADAQLNFASDSILVRDGIVSSLDEVVSVTAASLTVRTLSREALIRAYEYSMQDGYRKDQRGKNDQMIIDLLRAA